MNSATGGSKYRSRSSAQKIVGFSIAHDRNHLLARGLGLEHLKEMLVRLARPLLRRGANVAYAGHWLETEDNFTYDLLRLISAEQEDNSLGGADTGLVVGRMLNHSAWPDYLRITPRIEAQWIHCCRIVRVTQQMAGLAAADVVPDEQAGSQADRAVLNSAITFSAMRKLATNGMSIVSPAVPTTESLPPLTARILLGGKTQGYRGFVPGIFEEAYLALERQVPLYVLGGFGGAAQLLAESLLAPVGQHFEAFDIAWQEARTPEVVRLGKLAQSLGVPPGIMTPVQALEALRKLVETARPQLSQRLNTGLNEPQTRELLTTRDMRRATELVLQGLGNTVGLDALPG